MLVRCSACSAKFNVPDEKVAGKRARMKCKKCDAVILIDGTQLAVNGNDAVIQASERLPSSPSALASPLLAARAPTPLAAPAAAPSPAPRPLPAVIWEVAEPSGTRHQLSLSELTRRHTEQSFEPGTLVRVPSTTNWLPPYDIPELAEFELKPRPTSARPPSARPQLLTFSDETVALGVAESNALSRQAFAAVGETENVAGRTEQPSKPEPSRPALVFSPEAAKLQDARGFEDDEVATVVRSLDHLKELTQSPSKQPTLKPVHSPLPDMARRSAESQRSPRSPLPAVPDVPHSAAQPHSAARPHSAVRPPPYAPPLVLPQQTTAEPLRAAPARRHNPTLLGVAAPAIASAPGASGGAPRAAPLPSAVHDAGALAERPTEAAPVPAMLSPEWVNSSRMPVLSTPGLPSIDEESILPPSAHPLSLPAPLSRSGVPTKAPPPLALTAVSGTMLRAPGLSAPSAEAFTFKVPEARSGLGWIVFLSLVVTLGAALTGLYYFRPAIFFKGKARLEELFHKGTIIVGLAQPDPVLPAGPSFDTPSAGVVLERAAGRAVSCQEPAGPSGRGRVKVLYQPNGHASSALVSEPFHDTSVGRCLVGLFMATQVPPFGGDPVIVSKTFTVR